jgi:NADPH-dependent curcumin reductase CurA
LTKRPTPEPGKGEVPMRIVYLSLDPIHAWSHERRKIVCDAG